MSTFHRSNVLRIWIGLAWLVSASWALQEEYSSSVLSQAQFQTRAQPEELPQCGRTCLEDLPKNICGVDDLACFCNNETLNSATKACVSSSCDISDNLATQKYNAATCGVPVRDKSGFYRRFSWAMFTLASLFVIGRFISRTPQLGGSGFSWDDWTVLACYALLIPADVSGEMEVRHGLCKDMYMLTVPNVVAVLKWFYIGEVTYNIIIMGTKVSLVLLYLRIWSPDSASRAFRSFCWALVAIISATALVGALVIIFQCSPVSLAWLAITGKVQGHCIRLTPFTYSYAALNMVYDVIVLLLPVRNLIKLNVSVTKKIGICSVFLVGFLVTICSLVRLQYLVRLGDTMNITWDFQYIGMWSLVEANFSMVCCCMPALAGLAQRVWLKHSDPSKPAFSKSTRSAQTHLVTRSFIEPMVIRGESDQDPGIEMQYKSGAKASEHSSLP